MTWFELLDALEADMAATRAALENPDFEAVREPLEWPEHLELIPDELADRAEADLKELLAIEALLQERAVQAIADMGAIGVQRQAVAAAAGANRGSEHEDSSPRYLDTKA